MTVQSILNAKGKTVATARANVRISEVARLLTDKRIGALVISDDGRTVDGILSERDIIRRLARDGQRTLDMQAGELMTRAVHTGSLTDSVASVMAIMTTRRVRHVPIVEDGVLCGIVSIGDVVKARLDEVESEAHALRDYIAGG